MTGNAGRNSRAVTVTLQALSLLVAFTIEAAPAAKASKLPSGPVGWRMDSSGGFPEATPPLGWGPNSNVLWKTALPGYSAASPVLYGDSIIVMSDPLSVICVSKTDGKQLWSFNAEPAALPQDNMGDLAKAMNARAALDKEIADLEKRQAAIEEEMKTKFNADMRMRADDIDIALRKTRERRSRAGSLSKLKPNAAVGETCATPVCDGKDIVTLFNNGVLLCLTMDGKVRWATFLQGVNKGYGQSMSPAMAGDIVTAHVDDALYGVEMTSGKILWRESELQHQGSPVTMKPGGRLVFLTTNGNIRDPKTGKVLAKLNYPSLNLFTTPVVINDTAYFVAENRFLVWCTLSSQGGDDVTVKQKFINLPQGGTFYASPCVVGDKVFLWNNADYGLKKKTVHVYDTTAMKQVYELPLDIGGWAYPSPTFAGGFLYVFGDSGECQIYQPGIGTVGNAEVVIGTSRQYMLDPLGKYRLDTMRGCPVFEGDRMYARTKAALYCIKASKEDAKRGRESVDSKFTEKESIKDKSFDSLLQDM